MDQDKNHEIVVGHFKAPRRKFSLRGHFSLVTAGFTVLALLVIVGIAYALVPKLATNILQVATASNQSSQPSTSAPSSSEPTVDGSRNGGAAASPSSGKPGNSVSSISTGSGNYGSSTPSSSSTTIGPSGGGSSGNGGGGSGSGGSENATWAGDFSSGTLKGWLNQSCPGPNPPAGVTLSTTPAGSGGTYVAAFTVSDQSTDVYCPPGCNASTGTCGVPTQNPRAQLVGPSIFTNNSNWYIGFSTYFPASFPATTGWFQIAEIYGKPWGGSPSMGFGVKGNNLTFDRDSTHNYDTPWSAPMQRGVWENIIVHVEFSTDPNVGYVELWLNGVQQHFTDGSTRIYYDTLVPGINWDGSTPNDLTINQYRNVSVPMGVVTLYHAEAKAGPTYQSVLP